MIYHSTRNEQLTASSTHAVLQGIAPDGGLYICDPAALRFDWRAALEKDTLSMAADILHALLPDFQDMDRLVRDSYAGKFPTSDLTPLTPVADKYVLELYHGPTSAFKDVALSVLPRLIVAAAKAEGMKGDVVILTATSGDTGKAAMEGFHDVPGTRITVFYPYGGVSAVQQAQMATQEGANVRVCAVRGNFDDAQTGVKEIFAACKDKDLHGAMLSSANSINIGRLAPQVVYYFRAYGDLVKSGRIHLGDVVDYTVPTGNFGDILAGYFARQMGLPVGRLICASNANDVLTEFLTTGRYDKRRPFYKTTSPSMDICGCCDDAGAAEVIGRVWREHRYLCDPHTAVAWAVAEKHTREGVPMVVLSTASPYKFPAAVLYALGEASGDDEFTMMEQLHALTGMDIPKNLRGLEGRPVLHTDVIDKDAMLDYVLSDVLK